MKAVQQKVVVGQFWLSAPVFGLLLVSKQLITNQPIKMAVLFVEVIHSF